LITRDRDLFAAQQLISTRIIGISDFAANFQLNG
jgi:hypothetical protein